MIMMMHMASSCVNAADQKAVFLAGYGAHEMVDRRDYGRDDHDVAAVDASLMPLVALSWRPRSPSLPSGADQRAMTELTIGQDRDL